jgi:hypothetical protein
LSSTAIDRLDMIEIRESPAHSKSSYVREDRVTLLISSPSLLILTRVHTEALQLEDRVKL